MNDTIKPTDFDEMVGEAVRDELERQGIHVKADWGLVGYAAIEFYGFGPETLRQTELKGTLTVGDFIGDRSGPAFSVSVDGATIISVFPPKV